MNILQTENRVLGAIAGRLPSVPANSVTIWYQPAAPTGWVRVTGVATTWGLRVVPDGTGGGTYGGQHDPVLNDRVPSHIHAVSGTTGVETADHAHYVNTLTGTQSALHSHTVTVDAGGAHVHSLTGKQVQGAGALQSGGSYGTPTDSQTTASGGSHAHTASASTESATHAHAVATWTGGRNTAHGHTFAVTTATNVGADSYRPRHLDVILCRKE
jgi:hypothetical protein